MMSLKSIWEVIMFIRVPKRNDINRLITLSKKFADEYDWAKKIPIGQIKNLNEAKEWLFGDKIFKVLVAEEKGFIIGYVGIKRYENGYEASILIDSDYRRTGIGKRLINEIFKLIPEEIEVEAWVADFNKLSLKVTPKMGFTFKKKLLDKELIPGREFYVHIFTRKGTKKVS